MKQLLIRFYILALYSISAFGQTMTNEQIQNAINEIGNSSHLHCHQRVAYGNVQDKKK